MKTSVVPANKGQFGTLGSNLITARRIPTYGNEELPGNAWN
jgi:hypothetical protein